jgi:hypothetical protein
MDDFPTLSLYARYTRQADVQLSVDTKLWI